MIVLIVNRPEMDRKGDAADNFRGVSFDDWLRLIMQVSHSISCGLYA